MNKTVTLIVPCYNEEESLPIFYRAVCDVARGLPRYQISLLFVNDGSKDGTLNVMRNLAAHDERVKYLSFSRNFGKEAAMYAGFCNAKGDYVAVMDADMQDPPSLLPEMLAILETGEYDSVATRRVTRDGEPPIRSFFARLFYKVINRISEADVVDGARDFRLMKREMVDAIVSMCEYNRFSKGISVGLALEQSGCRIKMLSALREKPNGASSSSSSILWTESSIFRRHRCPLPQYRVWS